MLRERKDNLIHAFTGNPVTHNAQKKVVLSRTNFESESSRSISVCKNCQWAKRFTGITGNKG